MKKALPTGIMNYQELKTGGYYNIDKSMIIYDFLQRKSKVTLITRPHPPGAQGEKICTAGTQGGKTLNMSRHSLKGRRVCPPMA